MLAFLRPKKDELDEAVVAELQPDYAEGED
jgi:hypothetical protein